MGNLRHSGYGAQLQGAPKVRWCLQRGGEEPRWVGTGVSDSGLESLRASGEQGVRKYDGSADAYPRLPTAPRQTPLSPPGQAPGQGGGSVSVMRAEPHAEGNEDGGGAAPASGRRSATGSGGAQGGQALLSDTGCPRPSPCLRNPPRPGSSCCLA